MADYSSLVNGALSGVSNPYGVTSGAISGALSAYPGLSQAVQGAISGAGGLNGAIQAAAPYGQSAINAAVAAYNAHQNGTFSMSPALNSSGSSLLGDANTGGPNIVGSGAGTLGPLPPMGGTSSGGSGGGAGGGGSGGGGSAGGSFGSGLFSSAAPQQYAAPNFGGLPQFGNNGSISGYLPPNVGNMGIGNGQVPGSQISGDQGLPMMQMGAQNGLQQYYNTPGYQLTNGQGAVNQFQTSPGYQFAVNEALRQVQGQGASRGLLDSGAVMRAMTDRASGMANQEWNNWANRQQQMYGDYQNRLAGLAGGSVGQDQAYGLGQGLAQSAANTGNNVGSLLANQGNSLFGGIVGAGGAQAQNITQAGNMQAQILAGNLATQLAAAAVGRGGF